MNISADKLRGLGATIEKVDSEKDVQKFKLKSWLNIIIVVG